LSLFAASHGVKVDAVDVNKCPIILKNHPNIAYHQMNMYNFDFDEKYDCIVACNSFMFLEKEKIINVILPKINKSLKL